MKNMSKIPFPVCVFVFLCLFGQGTTVMFRIRWGVWNNLGKIKKKNNLSDTVNMSFKDTLKPDIIGCRLKFDMSLLVCITKY